MMPPSIAPRIIMVEPSVKTTREISRRKRRIKVSFVFFTIKKFILVLGNETTKLSIRDIYRLLKAIKKEDKKKKKAEKWILCFIHMFEF